MYPGGPHSPRDPPVVSPKGDWGGLVPGPPLPLSLGAHPFVSIFIYSSRATSIPCQRKTPTALGPYFMSASLKSGDGLGLRTHCNPLGLGP